MLVCVLEKDSRYEDSVMQQSTRLKHGVVEAKSRKMNDEGDDYGRSPWSGVEMMEESEGSYGNDVDSEERYG